MVSTLVACFVMPRVGIFPHGERLREAKEMFGTLERNGQYTVSVPKELLHLPYVLDPSA